MMPHQSPITRLARVMRGLAAATLVVAAAGCGSSSDSDAFQALPDVELLAVDGASTSSGDFVGEPLVINFWYSTCAPCAKELGDFAEVHAEVADEVRFIGVNPLDDPDTMLSFAGERGVEYELYNDDVAEFQTELGITSFPATVFVDATGRVMDTIGVVDADELRGHVDDLLRGAADAPAAGTTPEAADAGGIEGWNGIRRDPAPSVQGLSLPLADDPGTELGFGADPGRLQLVYWGFTNCPDVCPTTLADLAVALRMIGPLAEQVDVVLVSVDPIRDQEVATRYINAFVEGSQAVTSQDEQRLLDAAGPFGASWEIREQGDGTAEVDHSAFLYAIDDTGHLALTWQFGLAPDLMAADLTRLLGADAAEA